MKNEKIIELARKVLAKNEYFKEMFNGWNETAKTLTHWGQAETPEEMIYFNGENVVLSNECRVKVSDPTYTCELESSLEKILKK